MNLYDGQQFSEAQVIDSRIDAREFADYGYITAVNGGAVDVMLDAPATVWGNAVSNVELKNIELLFPVASGLSLEIEVKAGDQVLLLGLRTYVQAVANVKAQVSLIREKPASPFMYSRETIKAIPLSSLRTIGTGAGQSSLYMRAKAAKLQVKNSTRSLFTVLDNFEQAVKDFNTAVTTFSNTTSQASLTAGGASAPSLATAINALLATMNASLVTAGTNINTAKTQLAEILEA